ncbi:MAG TPA: hypothetical protein VD969_15775 [Symbiobacteriaceae bacterium]|nr:hypothetical protein [Symbiobacteriaceae bacterium]
MVPITVAGVFLMLNGLMIVATQDELEEVTLGVAEGTVRLPELTNWIRNYVHSRE